MYLLFWWTCHRPKERSYSLLPPPHLQHTELNMNYFLATSNKVKIYEYNLYGLPFEGRSVPDEPEPYSSVEQIAAYKSFKAGAGAICEDTSLWIEGADVGVLVKYLEHDLTEYIGRRTSFIVALSANDGTLNKVFKAQVDGVIVDNKFPEAYGFDGWFKPDGFDITLHELDLIDQKSIASARKKAVDKFNSGLMTAGYSNDYFEKQFEFISQYDYMNKNNIEYKEV